MPTTYTCHNLPKVAAELSPILDRYTKFRLDITSDASNNLARTHAYELTLTRAMWMARLLDPKKHNFLVVAHTTLMPATHHAQSLEDGEWVGMVQLLGPLSQSEYTMPWNATTTTTATATAVAHPSLGTDTSELRFHSSTWYMHPSHRGGEATPQLFEHVLNFIRELADDVLAPPAGTTGCARVRGTIAPGKEGGAGFVEALGYRVVGWWSMAQAYRAIDAAEVLAPEEEAPGIYGVRDRCVVENLIQC